jgi:hypothetical protein
MRAAAAGAALALAITPLAAAAGEITLFFGDAPGGAGSGFRIERREADAKRFQPLAVVGPGTPDFVDRGLPAGVTYCYRVRALGSQGDAAWSPEVCTAAEEEPAVAEGPAPATAGEGAGGEEAAPAPSGSETAAQPAPAGGEAAGTAATGAPAEEPRRIRTSGGWLQVLD